MVHANAICLEKRGNDAANFAKYADVAALKGPEVRRN
jgi:hypothetical protein